MPTISVALALGLVAGLIGVKLFGSSSTTTATAASATGASGQQAAAVSGKPVTLNFTEGDMFIKPSTVTVPYGADVTVHMTNQGPSQHGFSLEGANVPLINPGSSATEHWGVLTHSEQAWCPVSGHKEAGMLVNINVAGAPAGAQAASGSGGTSAAGATGATNDAKIDPNATPPKGWTPRDPTLPPLDGSTVHTYTFTVTEHNMQVAPGVTQQRWTYNGTSPGPILHGKVGDTFDIHLVNHGTMGHAIDFHASQVAPSIYMKTIQPGQSLDYKFKADYAGIFAYHCESMPMIDHIGNGMYGTIIIDPPNLDHVDKQIVLVQSELYLGPQGQPGDYDKMMADKPDATVFNGYYNQYAFAPIQVKAGERIRVWVMNDSLNEPCDFHIVGTIYDTVYKEGSYLLKKGNADEGGAQSLDLQTWQGGFVELTIPMAGQYTIVNHKMNDLMSGAVGFLKAS